MEEQFYIGFGLLIVVLRKNWLVGTLGGALALKFAVFQFVGNGLFPIKRTRVERLVG